MTKILQLVSTSQIKTDTKWLARLLPAIDRNRFELTVAAFYDDGPARAQFERHGIACRLLGVRSAWDGRSLVSPLRLIERLRPDLVHTHLLRADLFGGLAAAMTGTPLVSTVYAHGPYRRQYRRPGLDALLDRLTVRLPARIVAVCRDIKLDLVRRLGVPDCRVAVIHTGMDPLETAPADVDRVRRQYDLPSDRPVVMVPARLSYEKGIDTLLRAVRAFLDRGGRAAFLIAGTGALETELHNLAQRLDLQPHVRFLGFVHDIELLLAAADLVVLPSYSEGLPNAALETFAAARPLVASAVGGINDLAEYDPRAIVRVEPGRPLDLADRILEVLRSPSLAADLADRGLRIIKRNLATARVAAEYERLYVSLLQSEP